MQNIIYPLWSPHKKAKLYKRYTGDIDVEMVAEIPAEDDGKPTPAEIITIQDNRYVYNCSFTWVEVTSAESSGDQPVDGLLVQNEYVTIRTNSLNKFEVGDLVMLPKNSRLGGLWIISDGKTTEYTYTPKQIQTYQNLPLNSTG
jgi:hypothetical protein